MRMDPEAILMLQEMASITTAKNCVITVRNDGLHMVMFRGIASIEQIVSWMDLRFAAMGSVALVNANCEYMEAQLAR